MAIDKKEPGPKASARVVWVREDDGWRPARAIGGERDLFGRVKRTDERIVDV